MTRKDGKSIKTGLGYEEVNHVIVQVVTPDGYHLVEATSQYSINPYNDGVTGWTYTIDRTGN